MRRLLNPAWRVLCRMPLIVSAAIIVGISGGYFLGYWDAACPITLSVGGTK